MGLMVMSIELSNTELTESMTHLVQVVSTGTRHREIRSSRTVVTSGANLRSYSTGTITIVALEWG